MNRRANAITGVLVTAFLASMLHRQMVTHGYINIGFVFVWFVAAISTLVGGVYIHRPQRGP
jgi:hypothetical protein